MTDSLGGVPCAENESVFLIHGEPCPQCRPLILAYSTRIVLQTVYDCFVPQEVISYDIPLQRVLIEVPVLLGRHDLLAIQGGNRGFLDAQ